MIKNVNRKVGKNVFEDSENNLIIINGDMLSKYKDIEEINDDANFLKEIEEAYKLHDERKFKRINADAFLKELRKW